MEENSENQEQPESHQTDSSQGNGVVFLGWQKTSSGKEFALYNVTAEHHPLYGSTVTDQTLREHNLPVPVVAIRGSGKNGNSSNDGGVR